MRSAGQTTPVNNVEGSPAILRTTTTHTVVVVHLRYNDSKDDHMDIEDLIGLLQNPGDEGLPDTTYDDLRTAHSSAVANDRESSGANIAELEAAIGERYARIDKLMRDYWDLFEQSSKVRGDEQLDSEPDVDDQALTIDDLITFEDE